MKYLYDYFSGLALAITVAIGTFVLILIRKAFTNEKVIEAVKKDNKQCQELIQAKFAHSDEKMALMREDYKIWNGPNAEGL